MGRSWISGLVFLSLLGGCVGGGGDEAGDGAQQSVVTAATGQQPVAAVGSIRPLSRSFSEKAVISADGKKITFPGEIQLNVGDKVYVAENVYVVEAVEQIQGLTVANVSSAELDSIFVNQTTKIDINSLSIDDADIELDPEFISYLPASRGSERKKALSLSSAISTPICKKLLERMANLDKYLDGCEKKEFNGVSGIDLRFKLDGQLTGVLEVGIYPKFNSVSLSPANIDGQLNVVAKFSGGVKSVNSSKFFSILSGTIPAGPFAKVKFLVGAQPSVNADLEKIVNFGAEMNINNLSSSGAVSEPSVDGLAKALKFIPGTEHAISIGLDVVSRATLVAFPKIPVLNELGYLEVVDQAMRVGDVTSKVGVKVVGTFGICNMAKNVDLPNQVYYGLKFFIPYSVGVSLRNFKEKTLVSNEILLSSVSIDKQGVNECLEDKYLLYPVDDVGLSNLVVDDDFTVKNLSRNGEAIFTDPNPKWAGPISPTEFTAKKGELLQLKAEDSYGVCEQVPSIYLRNIRTGAEQLLRKGVSRNCNNSQPHVIYDVNVQIEI